MTDLVFRTATRDDLPAMIAMIADDQLGQARDDARLPLDQRYVDAFAAIERDPNQMLVAVEQAGELIGCFQITFIPGISRRGAWRGPDRIGAGGPRKARRRHRDGHVRVGHRRVPAPGLQSGPALYRQEPDGRPPLL